MNKLKSKVDPDKYTIKCKSGKVVNMSEGEFVRWMCLIEGISYISEKCDSLKLAKDDGSWVKPVAIQHYIKERYVSMLHDVRIEHQLGNV